MSISVVVPALTFPVTLAEAKAQMRLEGTSSDALVTHLIAVAASNVANQLVRRALEPQTYELTLDMFPCGAIKLPVRPLISVEAVYYDDEEGDEQIVDPSSYFIDTTSDPGWVVPVGDFSWPETLGAVNAVRIRFRAGYEPGSGDVSTVPPPLKHAILVTVADLFEYRESVAEGSVAEIPMPATVKALIEPYRVFEDE